MKRIFESREFSNYHVTNLNESRGSILESTLYTMSQQTTVFLSHKHDDLENLKDIIGFLQTEYKAKVYIDSRDPSLPKATSGETATRIKDRIKKCNKFILLATEGAIESKWCNWELGFGDAHKYADNIAIFPIKPKGTIDSAYKGNEYMEIYSYISSYSGTEQYNDGRYVPRGYYVRKDADSTIIPLDKWLSQKQL